MFILQDLWDGNVYPAERRVRRGGDYERLLNQLLQLDRELHQGLDERDCRKLENYEQLKNELQSMQEEGSFIAGFRMGVQLLLDALGEYDSPLP